MTPTYRSLRREAMVFKMFNTMLERNGYNNVRRTVSTVDFTELRRFKYVDTTRSTPDLHLRVEKSMYVDGNNNVTGNINSNGKSHDSNEETRASNEESRGSNEESHVSNEETRASNEESRGSNEESRDSTKSDIEINKQHDIKPKGFLRNIGKFFIGLSCWRKNIN